MPFGGFISRLGRVRLLGASLAGAAALFVSGIVFWGGFNTAMEATNQMDFCISCHEMKDNVYKEYTQTIHFQNRSGVQATCPDCHVPKDWVHKTMRKIQASNELLHWALGTVDTPEKFDGERLRLAKNVWAAMERTDSRECRNCHSFQGMGADKQKPRAKKQHEMAQKEGMTCINCHKGIAHKPVHHLLEEEGGEKKDAELVAAVETRTEAKVTKPVAPAVPVVAPVEAPKAAEPVQVAAAAPAATPSAVDWAKVPEKKVMLFYPGQTSFEWIQNGPDHGGARAFKKGEECAGCHEGEQADMGAKIVSGEKAETTPIPGKAASIPMTVQASHDGANLYMRFRWPANPHAPVPFAEGGKMDPANPVKLALMIDQGLVQDADRSGCWSSCHHDARSMPSAPDAGGLAGTDIAKRLDLTGGVTKYLPQTRTAIELKGDKRGGWDKLKSDDELKQLMADGVFLDLIRWNAGTGVVEDGYVSAERVMTGGEGATFVGEMADGAWTVTMTRKLKSEKAGDVSIEPGKTYTIGFAIHDDYSGARFHHVSVNYKLGLDSADAAINAVKQ